ncbi:MAG: hypothetical protein COA69_10975 [Robiginitomaculum sp.]|nr:MAG: hypothetical protein COA69_10975 [Robiginitomaculum sp.]
MTSNNSSSLSRRTLLLASVATSLSACATVSQGKATGSELEHKGALRGDELQDLLSIYALNVETWWRDRPLAKRFDAAAKAGFTQVEMWGLNSTDRAPAQLRQAANDAGVEILHCTVDVPDFANTSAQKVYDAARKSLDQIQILGARYATIVAHANVEGMSKPDMLAAYRDRLREITPLFEAAGVMGLVEPFNPYNHPGHFMYGAGDAVEICRSIDSPNIKLNWDLFHMQRAEGNVVYELEQGIDQCGYLQIADSPHRREPGTGEMNYAFILSEALSLGYSGPIGLECFPNEGRETAAVRRVIELAKSIES